MEHIHHSSNPLIKHLVNSLRDTTISPAFFRKNLALIAQNLLLEAAHLLPQTTKQITTWQGENSFSFIDQRQIVCIPILRAGIPMMDGVLELLPEIQAGFLAMKRDEKTFKPTIFYKRFPSLANKIIIIVDPMVATGGSLIDAISLIKEENPAHIISLNLIAAPEGLHAVSKTHSDVSIFIAQIDDHLNAKKYIIPGLGDAGDRAYNTEG
ncbi:uracil phosphoribosyltransferase [Nitratiruptor sp. YY09-18]|uniref:uracil phosphoribosyltransferase n=1 Tax=Nitratiruptor sp. YY09-18 TaxID=2724901 RepID=UPI001915DA8B|nr:uracil phosphoribosyltransferase [Nitratiruptor sp. YY09-18]BCD68847.1 uracil phosphoribosyltransferase [Nitratiruptor sp. YY09-18]